ncbi:hypothetical protein MHOCP_05360 [Moorella humiferrea]|uniref:NAD(P)/FAD-dependent oxidoreductase n=1 Tax=Neomoorella humiferrea TaxID=676965 RepID=UPI0030D280A7
MLRVTGIKIPVTEKGPDLHAALLRKLGIPARDLLDFSIYRLSLDARSREMIYWVYTLDARVKNEDRLLKRHAGDKTVTRAVYPVYRPVQSGEEMLPHRPVIIGTGPAGLFAGLLLARRGYRPILLERGGDVDTRTKAVARFFEEGILDPGCNVQFGEGGAGTFSDGKLTTLINDHRCRFVLEEFVRWGAPREILYYYRPHIGTDILRLVVKNMRREITRLGGEVYFNTRVTDLIIKNEGLAGLVINNSEKLPAAVAVLACGHSARDTFKLLLERGVRVEPKPFSIGVRIEHPQELINLAQYKRFAGIKGLGPADYKLAYHAPAGRSAYTFCMCPGGSVVAAASEPGGVVTNGMSTYARDGENANSALLVGVTPDDFGSDHPLAGIEFQRRWERLAFRLGGENYHAPVQLVGDFLAGRPSEQLGKVRPTYRPGVALGDLKDCLPDYVVATLREAIAVFDRKVHGFALPEAVLTGVETRSSSPVRIWRDARGEAGVRGLYPAGEGAGYAGGIVSAAVDGLKVAEAIIARYRPLE